MKAKRRIPAPERKVKNSSKERSVNFLSSSIREVRKVKKERTITFLGFQHQTRQVRKVKKEQSPFGGSSTRQDR